MGFEPTVFGTTSLSVRIFNGFAHVDKVSFYFDFTGILNSDSMNAFGEKFSVP